MHRRLPFVLFIVSALLFLRFTGLHAHLHNHTMPHDGTGSEIVHLASGAEHGASHSQDVEVNILDALLSKHSSNDFDNALPLAATLLILLSLSLIGRMRPLAVADVPPLSLVNLRPPSQAPPA